mmetsp:Transcript_18514/g.32362  ORF Transcript_18514/g.32362 Transcript_18514/m.32362 type:complete len:93 (-) Transcript_18514:337-615(-)
MCLTAYLLLRFRDDDDDDVNFSFKSNLSNHFRGRTPSFYKQTLPPQSAISQYHNSIIIQTQEQYTPVQDKTYKTNFFTRHKMKEKSACMISL